MKSQALRPAIWMTHFIMGSLAISLVFLLSLYYYYGYSINSVVQLEFLDIQADSDVDNWIMNTKIALLAIAHVMGIFVFWKVRKMLLSIKQLGPFDLQIIKQIRLIMISTIIFILFYTMASFIIDLTLGELRIIVNTSTLVIIFLIFLVYLLIEIFKYGTEIKEEQKLTI